MIWPDDKKCAMSLCFDLDADTMWFLPDYTAPPSQTSRGEYAVNVALPRITELLDRHGLKATFFVPGFVIDKYTDAVKRLIDLGHEVGHHGYNHERNHQLAPDDERDVMARGLEAFERAGLPCPVGYRSPAWEFSPATLDIVTSAGFLYDSSLMGDEKPYMLCEKSSGKTCVELPVEWILDDAPYFLFSFGQKYKTGMSDPDKVLRIWKDEFDGYRESGSYFNLTMHPQITGKYHRLKMLDKLLTYIESKGDVYFGRCRDIAEYFKSIQK